MKANLSSAIQTGSCISCRPETNLGRLGSGKYGVGGPEGFFQLRDIFRTRI